MFSFKKIVSSGKSKGFGSFWGKITYGVGKKRKSINTTWGEGVTPKGNIFNINTTNKKRKKIKNKLLNNNF